MAVQIVAAGVGCAPGRARPAIADLTLDPHWRRDGRQVGVRHTSATPARTASVVKVGTTDVDHREHRHAAEMRAQLTSGIENGRAARQIEQHRHIASPQFAQRRCGIVGPHDREIGGRQDTSRSPPDRGGAA